MHDCPNCRVPLHGHEDVCPSCGTQQYVRKGFSSDRFVSPKEPSVNIVPIVIAVLVIGAGAFFAMQVSWVGQVMNRGPVQENPIDKMTFLEARQYVQSKITEGLTAVGAKGKFSWTSNGTPADMNVDQFEELDIQTRLQDKEQRRAIIDPIKDYMAKAKIPTLTMSDSRSHATWTYTVSTPTTPSSDDDTAPPAGDQPAPNADPDRSAQPVPESQQQNSQQQPPTQ